MVLHLVHDVCFPIVFGVLEKLCMVLKDAL